MMGERQISLGKKKIFGDWRLEFLFLDMARGGISLGVFPGPANLH